MISIIITAKDEAQTIGQAVEAFLKQGVNDQFEIIVVAPDEPTLKAAKAVSDKVYPVKSSEAGAKQFNGVKVIQDKAVGKAEAMNLAIGQARGEKLIFSDGDVIVADDAVKELLAIDGDAVTGRPMPWQEDTDSKFAYWQRVLFGMADRLRKERDEKSQFLLLSGYLFLINKKILDGFKPPDDLLTEDEYLSYWVWHKGYKIRYAPAAGVRVKYPDNYGDWVKQKVRTLAGGYQIPKGWREKTAMRSFWRESFRGLGMWFRYVKNVRQALWMNLLFVARLEVWFLAFIKVKLLKQDRQKIWQRVASTK